MVHWPVSGQQTPLQFHKKNKKIKWKIKNKLLPDKLITRWIYEQNTMIHTVRHRFLQKKNKPRGNTKHTSRQHIKMCAITIHLPNYLQQSIIYHLSCILKNDTYPPIPIMHFIVASCQRSFLGPSVTIMNRGMWVGNPRKYPLNRAKTQ